ncbi:hypothetical protein [Staphylothermus hellenicus]|uniref:Uncharacterized protein n=1 Tax=Staphylothermus hellenicus (strain DSM 12710 / JCM 10830 / BK20S6-10-b1 / P8) TaxID=591019 RepID=D7DAW1_STAHD|nr:hypothetical protein [Staphylothermus hellenicus]ADI31308.1 hypothetical protein Shell_0165 [Staphylothermus hellenicus DSM 12710]
MDLDRLLDAWFLMRIATLGANIRTREKPWLDFTFHQAMNLCHIFAVAKDMRLITWLAVDEYSKTLNFPLRKCEELGFNTSYESFSKFLKELDHGAGVFILAHWLAYIFNYREKADLIWLNFPIFYSIANELYNGKKVDELEKIIIGRKRLRDPWTGLKYTHVYYNTPRKLLLRTLRTLSNYGGSLANYIDEKLRECSCIDENNWIRLLAAILNILTYEREEFRIGDLCKYAEEKHFLLPRNIEPYRLNKLKVSGTKRLWAALRDYIVNPYFRLLLINSLSENNPIKPFLKQLHEDIVEYEGYLEQLELPGDVWNKVFLDRYIVRLGEKYPELFRKNNKIITGDSRTSARRLYQWLSRHVIYGPRVQRERLFPVYLDVTFGLRKGDLELFMNKSESIKRRIEKEIDHLRAQKDVLKAYDILRHELNKNIF